MVIDGGNSYYRDDIARAKQLKRVNIHYLDRGTSGGVWGLERGYRRMVGGETELVHRLDPIFPTIAPGAGDAEPTSAPTSRERPSTAICTGGLTAPVISSKWSITGSSTG